MEVVNITALIQKVASNDGYQLSNDVYCSDV